MTASAQVRRSQLCFVVYASTSALDSVADGARSATPSIITTSRTVPRATRTRRTRPIFTVVGELALVAKESILMPEKGQRDQPRTIMAGSRYPGVDVMIKSLPGVHYALIHVSRSRHIQDPRAAFPCCLGIGYRHDIPGVNYQPGRPLPPCTVSWV